MGNTSPPPRAGWVPFLCFISNLVCYADRTNISVALLAISAETGWDDAVKGIIFGSFFAGYMCTQVLGGYLSGKIGGRPVLAVAIFFWSVFTLLTPPAVRWGLGPLACCRAAMGLAEGMTMPAIHNLIGRWVPRTRRSCALALSTSGQFVGTVVALSSSALVAWRWDAVFYAYGLAGMTWAVAFYLLCPETPQDSDFSPFSRQPRPPSYAIVEESSPSDADTDALEHGDRRALQHASPRAQMLAVAKVLLLNPAFLAVMCAHVAHNYGYYVVLMWLPKYFLSLHVDLKDVGFFALLPYVCMFVFDLVWGRCMDLLLARKAMSLLSLRKMSQVVAFLTPTLFLLILVNVTAPSRTLALLLVSAALGANSASHSGYWANIIDLAPAHAGFICGVSNTVATMPGIFGNVLTGWILDTSGSWACVFGVCALCYMLGLGVYLRWADTRVLQALK